MVTGEIETVKPILYYRNYLPLAQPYLPGLSVFLPPRSMRSIRLVIALLYPRDELQHAFNRICPQG